MADKVTIPNISAPFLMPDGQISVVWFQYLIGLLRQTNDPVIPELDALILLVRSINGQSNATVDIPQSFSASSASLIDPGAYCAPAIKAPAQVFLGDVPAHGLQVDEALHALATTTLAGFMSAADKAKLNTIPGSISNFMVYQSVAQAVPGGAATPLTFTTKLFDDNTEYSIATSQFVPAISGTYVFTACVTGTQGAVTRRQLAVLVNGVQTLILQDSNGNTGACSIVGCTGPVKLVAGDIVQIAHLTNIADTTVATQSRTYFGGWRIK